MSRHYSSITRSEGNLKKPGKGVGGIMASAVVRAYNGGLGSGIRGTVTTVG